MRSVTAFLGVAVAFAIMSATGSAQPRSECGMFLKRVTLTGSVKSLSCYPMRTAGYSTFSRNHRWLIYQPRGFEYSSSEIRIARTDGTLDRRVVTAPGPISAFAWSPDERTVVFSTYRVPTIGGESGTWSVRKDGIGLRKLWDEGVVASSDDDEIEWSPDSRWVVFRDLHPDSSPLIKMRVEDGAREEVGSGYRPRWSPNGKWIAFQHGRKIRIVSAGGGPSRTVALGWIGDWSPDSRVIAFSRTREDPTLWVVPAHGGRARPISRRASGWFDRAWLDLPVWSPRGKQIASVAYDQFRRRNVLLVAAVGKHTRPRPIARHPSYRLIDALSWAKDGRSILYLTDTAD